MSGSTTRADEAYGRIRRDVLNGRHRPGSKLLAGTLCDQYGISSGVLREVLPRLAGEGLVVSEPQRGFRVADVSVEDLRQLTELRILVESEALRQAIAHGDLRYEADLVAAHHTLAGSRPLDPSGDICDEWLQAHAAFHHALLAGAPNLRLQSVATQLRDATEVYRCWSGPLGDEPDRDVAGEHRRILDATIARTTEVAVALLSQHYEHTTAIMIRYAEGEARSARRTPA
jgi:DNA-binding GntR family transcriptional regulator